MKNKLIIIEAPSNLGLIEPMPGKEPGVRKLPEWLRSYGLYEKLSPRKIIQVTAPAYKMELNEETGVRNTDEIITFSKKLSYEVLSTLKQGLFPLVIGGDCSVLIGSVCGLKTMGRYGLFYIDGHTDFIMPHTSSTKGAAGMDLAIVTGNGHEKLTNIDGLKPYINESDVIAFGNRYFDRDYVNTIKQSDVIYFDLPAIRKKGIESIVKAYLNRLEVEKCDGFWIHLDVDVLDDAIMPCVDSRQIGGLTYDELKQTLTLLLHSPLSTGMNLGILDPDLDPAGIYTAGFVKEFASVFD